MFGEEFSSVPWEANLVANDTVLPAQFFARNKETAEHKLLLAIIWDAVKCAENGVKTFHCHYNNSNQRLMREALNWINGKSSDLRIFTFSDICESFDLKAEWVRTRIYIHLFKVSNDPSFKLRKFSIRRPRYHGNGLGKIIAKRPRGQKAQ